MAVEDQDELADPLGSAARQKRREDDRSGQVVERGMCPREEEGTQQAVAQTSSEVRKAQYWIVFFFFFRN